MPLRSLNYKMLKGFWKNNKDAILAICAVVLLYAFFHLVGIGCPVKFVTGISCAGCGMTRAYYYLLQGDIGTAFFYHPLFIIPPIFVFVFLCRNRINSTVYKAIIFTFIAIFAIVYVYRMLFGINDIVVFRPKESIVYRVYEIINPRRK